MCEARRMIGLSSDHHNIPCSFKRELVDIWAAKGQLVQKIWILRKSVCESQLLQVMTVLGDASNDQIVRLFALVSVKL